MFSFWLLFSGPLRDQLAWSFQCSVYLGSVELKKLNYLFHKCIKIVCLKISLIKGVDIDYQ